MNSDEESAIQYLTLSDAAKLAPGRPSTSCLWRWCRKGVKAKSGVTVRLQHARFGGRVFTTSLWLDDFGKAVAEADRAYFEVPDQPVPPVATTRSRTRAGSRSRPKAHEDFLERQRRIEAELDAEGL